MSTLPPPTLAEAEHHLRETFHLTAFRPGQREVISALLVGQGALAVFPTGGGKSLCYQLPALLFGGLTLVVSPLLALMREQVEELRRLGIAAARLDSSLSGTEVREIGRDLRSGRLRLLYVAPERFNNERFLREIAQVRISLFAVDEAHCISEWGHNFRPDYLKLAGLARSLGVERVLALTATATPLVVGDICRGFAIPERNAVAIGFYRPNLRLRLLPMAASERDRALLTALRERPAGTTIVYATLQRTAERVAENLAAAGLPARAYHAGMDDVARAEVQAWWRGSDRAIVVDTIAYGMGIDKADVRFVYHYNLPKSLESYSQEIGRAGRDGAPATAELYATADDLVPLENFVYGDTPTAPALAALLDEIAALPTTFAVDLYELANRLDVRQIVLRTALTYLELRGALRQETPFYARYEVRPLVPEAEIADRFAGERASFVAAIFASARRGTTWLVVSPDELALARAPDDVDRQRAERGRIVRALDYLAEQGTIELRVSGPRLRFTRLVDAPEVVGLAAELVARFVAREAQEIARLGQVVELVQADRCQANALAAHFGEQRGAPCGQCAYCDRGTATSIAPRTGQAPRLDGAELDEIAALRAAHPAALGHPRQLARFLAGLSSPAASRARLARHRLYGRLADTPFVEVLALAESEDVTPAGCSSPRV